ncbi:hypothetical protein C0993_000085 [Termitomyces sp. T159_Od127]|nr:hypothetical protein C0993_000085 [Termitomyces sp. T159_Od127]
MLSSPPKRLTAATRFCSLIIIASLSIFASADPIPVSVPSIAPGHNAVQSSFLGVSLELSFMNEYFGNDTSTIPPTIINYLSAIRGRTGNTPLRLRIGGNSMDSSIYIPDLATPMLQNTSTAANANNQPVEYGSMLWKVMKKVADDIGGAEYLIGEPDLYTSHNQRPNIKNYTTDIYINVSSYEYSKRSKNADAPVALLQEFKTVSNRLANTSAGNLLDLKNLGGPTVCCFWVWSGFSLNVKFHAERMRSIRTLTHSYKADI